MLKLYIRFVALALFCMVITAIAVAAAVLKLAEQDRLSLDDSIARFFPAVPDDKLDITLHQLLTHTAGLEQHYAADGIVDRNEAVHAILAHPLVRLPGAGFGHSRTPKYYRRRLVVGWCRHT